MNNLTDVTAPRFALTGSIGTGKSAVAEILDDLGCFVIDADQLARDVVAPGSPVLAAIIDLFGPEYLTDEQTLNRTRLGKTVFSDSKKRSQLEELIHPAVRQEALKRAADCPRDQALVYVVPLLFEAGTLPPFINYSVVVTAPYEDVISRVVTRDSCTKELAEKKWRAQLPQEEKVARADFIIQNHGTLAELRRETQRIFSQILETHADSAKHTNLYRTETK